MTPEGKVKRSIRRVLDSFDGVYYFMPVQTGLGAAGVDFHCVVRVTHRIWTDDFLHVPVAFFIEAKDEGKEPTGRQENFLRERREQQNCRTFVIDGDASLQRLIDWLEAIEEVNEHSRALSNLQVSR